MGLLPGQINNSNGVSNLMFGTNVPPYAAAQFMGTPAIQQKIKAAGITILRCALTTQSGAPFSDATLDQISHACVASGCIMLAIIPHQSLSFAQHAVSYLGNRCMLYELGNEPDCPPTSMPVAQYSAMWNSWIPQLRAINANAAYIGPALCAVSNIGGYLKTWLQNCVSANVLPDAVSWHDYPCTQQPTQAACMAKAGNIGSDANYLNGIIRSVTGKSIPIACTEWNVDASNPRVSYAQNASYVNTWSIAALEGMASAKVAIGCQFWYGDIVSENAPYSTGMSYAPMVVEIGKYVGTNGRPPLSFSIPIITPIISGISSGISSAANAVGITDIFGGAHFIPIAATQFKLAPTADVTEMLATLDNVMIIQNPFTENMGAIPTDTIGIAGVGFTFTDPFSWIEQIGTNLFYDTTAALFRLAFLIVGTLILVKVVGEFIDYEAIGESVGGLVETAIKMAVLV